MNYCEVDFSLRKSSALSYESFQVLRSINRIYRNGLDLNLLSIMENYTSPRPPTLASVQNYYFEILEDIDESIKEGENKINEFMSHILTVSLTDSDQLREAILDEDIAYRWPVSAGGYENYSIPLRYLFNMPAYSMNMFTILENVVVVKRKIINMYLQNDFTPSIPFRDDENYKTMEIIRASLYYNVYTPVLSALRRGFGKIKTYIIDSQSSRFFAMYNTDIIIYILITVSIYIGLSIAVYFAQKRLLLVLSCYTLLKPGEVDLHINVLSRIAAMYENRKFNEKDHLATNSQLKQIHTPNGFNSNMTLQALNQIKKEETVNSSNTLKQKKKMRESGLASSIKTSIAVNNVILILFLILFTFMFFLKSAINKVYYLRNIKIGLCEKSMDVNNNILGVMLYTVTGKQIRVEDNDSDEDFYKDAPTQLGYILLDNYEELIRVIPEEEKTIDTFLKGDLCELLNVQQNDTRGIVCGENGFSAFFMNHGIIGFLVWLKENSIAFRAEMKEGYRDFLDYSDGRPIFGDLPWNKTRVSNDQVIWGSQLYIDVRYITRIVWSKLYHRLSNWIQLYMDRIDSKVNGYIGLILLYALLLVLLPTLLASWYVLNTVKREYMVALETFKNIDAHTIAANPSLMFHLKKFFRYSNY